MAVSSYSAFKTNLLTKGVRVDGLYGGPGGTTGFLQGPLIAGTWPVYTTPTSPVTCDNTTLGSIPIPGGTALRSYKMIWSGAGVDHVWMLCDRLSHQGGLSGSALGAQTTNLPTAALTRHTSGEGVFAAIMIYTSISSSAQTVTMSYTNQAGTSGQTSRSAIIGGTNNQTAGRLIVLPLADGDTGVQAVASITLSGSTGTAGNLGIVLFKPVAMYFSDFSNATTGKGADQNLVLSGGLQMESIEAGASLFFVNSGTAGGNVFFDMTFAPD